jgi:putative ABC transport system permease protein
MTNNFVIIGPMANDVLGHIGRDAARVFRFLRARPGFGVIVLVTLALGIGAPTAVFSVVNAVMLRPLPYPDAGRLVQFRIESRGARAPNRTIVFDALPASVALQWATESAAFESMALYNDRALTLSAGDGPERLTGIAATPNLFELLGVAPARGRTFEPRTVDMREIVLSDRTWRRFFAADPAVVGSPVTLDGEQYRIAGVMAPGFKFPTAEAAFWVPLRLDAGGGRGMLLPAIARLKPLASVAEVSAEGARALAAAGGRDTQTLFVRTLQEQLVGGVGRVLWILLAAVSVVAVIATTNVALLLLVRGAGRAHEFSIRLALGAGRLQLARQLLVEAATFAALGGLGGLLLAAGFLRVLLRFAPPALPRADEIALDAPVLVFALSMTMLSTLVFGLLSAGRTMAVDPVRTLAGGGVESRLGGGRPARRRMNALAAAALALTTILLAGAGLLLRSFVSLVLVDQGFDSTGALALRVSLPAARYAGAAPRLAFHERLLERLRHLDGVRSAGLVTSMPNRQPTGRFDFNAGGLQPFDPMGMKTAEVRMATDGFFEAMGIPIVSGRAFQPADRAGSEAVVIISEQLARSSFPGGDAAGKLLYSHAAGTLRVVGVARDVRPADGGEPAAAAYLPLRQAFDSLEWLSTMNVLVRGGNPGALASAVRALVLSLDAEIPTYTVRTLGDEVSSLVAGPRFVAIVLGAFAGAALVLATIGVYGVMAYSAARRTREIGVRVALGATRAQVLRFMMLDGAIVVAVGLSAGILLALALSRTLTGVLHELQSMDLLGLAPVAVLLAAAGLLAAYVPARRATRVSALDALRYD